MTNINESSPDTTEAWRTKRQISHAEALEIAGRLINSHFRQEPHARVGIPARPEYDDDLLIISYIRQQQDRADGHAQSPADAEEKLTRLMDDAWPDGHRAMARRILENFTLSPVTSTVRDGADEPKGSQS